MYIVKMPGPAGHASYSAVLIDEQWVSLSCVVSGCAGGATAVKSSDVKLEFLPQGGPQEMYLTQPPRAPAPSDRLA